MIIYLLFLIFALMIINKANKLPLRKQYNYCIWILAFLIIFFSVRDVSVGTDYINYYYHYKHDDNNFAQIYSEEYWYLREPIWHLGSYLIKSIGLTFQAFSFIFIIVNSVILYNICKRIKTPLLFLTFFVICYYYYSGFNIMRQFAAANVISLGLIYLDKRKIIPFICACLVASLIHKTALYVIFFSFLAYIPITKKSAIIAIIGAWVFLYLGIDHKIFPFLDFASMSDYYGNNAVAQYSQYLDNQLSGLNTMGIIMYWMMIVLKMLLFILVIVSKKENLTLYEKFWFLGILILISTANYQWLFRMSIYFMIPQTFVLASFYTNLQKNNRSVLSIVLLFIVSIIYIFSLYNNAEGIVPYII